MLLTDLDLFIELITANSTSGVLKEEHLHQGKGNTLNTLSKFLFENGIFFEIGYTTNDLGYLLLHF